MDAPCFGPAKLLGGDCHITWDETDSDTYMPTFT